MSTFSFDSENRTPFNNKIYPGNYVTHLNAYREQGVVALPGAVFFRGVGALVLSPDNDANLDANGVLAAATYDLQVLSPDMRQDDKPRKDRAFVVPAGAVVYRTAVSAPGVREEVVGTGVSIAPAGITTPTAPAMTASADGFFAPVGELSGFTSLLEGSGLGSATAVQVTVNGGGVIAKQNPTAGADRDAPSALLVEVCYFLPDAAPSLDDVNIPYGVEAGQGY